MLKIGVRQILKKNGKNEIEKKKQMSMQPTLFNLLSEVNKANLLLKACLFLGQVIL